MAFAAPLAGRLVEHYPAGLLGGIGLTLFACGLGALAFLPASPTPVDVIWRMALAGAGFGLFQTPNNRTMLDAKPVPIWAELPIWAGLTPLIFAGSRSRMCCRHIPRDQNRSK